MTGRTRRGTALASRGLFGLVLAVALLLVGAAAAQAATFTVNTTADNPPTGSECSGAAGDCSLRQAIDKSNATTSDDTINVPAGHYILTIAGADEDSDQTGDLDVNNGTASITNTTIANNTGPDDGGGVDIDTDGTVAFVNDTISGNHADSADGGGVWIPSGGSVSFLNTIVANNTAKTAARTDCN